jgi:pimeloyl-ACP methyl ester carboxylesterase
MLFELTVPLWYGSWDELARQHAADQKRQVDVRAAMSIRNDLARWSQPDLSKVEVPVLVVGGSLDFLTPPAAAHAVRELFTDGTYVEIEGAGHFPWLDDAEAFTAIVDDFVGGEGLTSWA